MPIIGERLFKSKKKKLGMYKSSSRYDYQALKANTPTDNLTEGDIERDSGTAIAEKGMKKKRQRKLTRLQY